MANIKPSTFDEYMDVAPEKGRQKLSELRAILREVAPEAKESIKWGHPVFEDKRILFSFSAFNDHINFTPTGPSIEPFRAELVGYKTHKDSIQFSYDKDLPTELIRKIAAFRVHDVRQNDAKWMY